MGDGKLWHGHKPLPGPRSPCCFPTSALRLGSYLTAALVAASLTRSRGQLARTHVGFGPRCNTAPRELMKPVVIQCLSRCLSVLWQRCFICMRLTSRAILYFYNRHLCPVIFISDSSLMCRRGLALTALAALVAKTVCHEGL